MCDGAGSCIDLCAELCFDFMYCINEPADDCIANCAAALVDCSTSDLATLLHCHQAFAYDCHNLFEFSDCVNAEGCALE